MLFFYNILAVKPLKSLTEEYITRLLFFVNLCIQFEEENPGQSSGQKHMH